MDEKELTLKANENKKLFIEALSKVNRSGIPELLDYLESTDFYIAPASTKYHCNFFFFFCEHSLNVYRNILKLNNEFNLNINNDSLVLVSLLHDISKVNF